VLVPETRLEERQRAVTVVRPVRETQVRQVVTAARVPVEVCDPCTGLPTYICQIVPQIRNVCVPTILPVAERHLEKYTVVCPTVRPEVQAVKVKVPTVREEVRVERVPVKIVRPVKEVYTARVPVTRKEVETYQVPVKELQPKVESYTVRVCERRPEVRVRTV